MNLLGFIMSLVYMQAVHGRLSTYERLVNLNIVIHLIDIREGPVIKPQSIINSISVQPVKEATLHRSKVASCSR